MTSFIVYLLEQVKKCEIRYSAAWVNTGGHKKLSNRRETALQGAL